MRVSVAGQFDIGYRATVGAQTAFHVATKHAQLIVVLVGDVGVSERNFRGTTPADLAGQLVHARWDCSDERLCVVSQRLSTAALATLVDEAWANEAVGRALANSGLDADEFRRWLREELVKPYALARVSEYGSSRPVYWADELSAMPHGPAIVLVRERWLINRARVRMRARRSERPESWHRLGGALMEDPDNAALTFLALEPLTGRSGAPICRAVMLALYQQLCILGARSIEEFVEARHEAASRLGQELYAKACACAEPGATGWTARTVLRVLPDELDLLQ